MTIKQACSKLTALGVHPTRVQEFTPVRDDIHVDTATVREIKLFNDKGLLKLLLFRYFCTLVCVNPVCKQKQKSGRIADLVKDRFKGVGHL